MPNLRPHKLADSPEGRSRKHKRKRSLLKESSNGGVIGGMSRGMTIGGPVGKGISTSWGRAARLWDKLQGTFGDNYRRKILAPAVVLAANRIRGKKLLDVGCANGCMARNFARAGAIVTAVDKHSSMLSSARRYRTAGIEYACVDIEGKLVAVKGGPFDVIVASFVLQDCDSLEEPLRFIQHNLASDGQVIVIAESDRAFSDGAKHHATSRYWIDALELRGRGGRQVLRWKVPLGEEEFCTVTRHWSESSYVDAARKAGLRLVARGRQREVSSHSPPNSDESTVRAVTYVFRHG